MKNLILTPLLISAFALNALAVETTALESVSQRIANEDVNAKNIDALYMESLFKSAVLDALEHAEYVNVSLGLNKVHKAVVIPTAIGVAASSYITAAVGSKVMNVLPAPARLKAWKQTYKYLARDAKAKMKAYTVLAKRSPRLSERLVLEPIFTMPSVVQVAPVTTVVGDTTMAIPQVIARETAQVAENAAAREAGERIVLSSIPTPPVAAVLSPVDSAKIAAFDADVALKNHLRARPGGLYRLGAAVRSLGKITLWGGAAAATMWAVGDSLVLMLPQDTATLKANLHQDVIEIDAILEKHDADLQAAINAAINRFR